MELDPRVVAHGVRHLSLESIGSTNTEALARARAGDRGPLWVTARLQTAGRGRRGRTFISEPGNLFASLLLTNAAPPEQAAELSFVAALAAYDAVVHRAPTLAPRLAVKWPNDVLCDGAKLVGILVEGETPSTEHLATVVGIGVNCIRHPGGLGYPAIDLAAAGAAVTADSLFQALSLSMMWRLAEWNCGRNFVTIRNTWLTRAFGLGKRVGVRLADRDLTGVFETLDEAGRMVLRGPDGTRELVTAGDVIHVDGGGRPQVATDDQV